MGKNFIYAVSVGISLCLFAYDWIMRIWAKDDSFVKLEKGGTTLKSVFYIVFMSAVSYWGSYGIMRKQSGYFLLVLVCIALLILLVVEFFLLKRGIKAFCVIPLAVIAFAEAYFMHRIGVAGIPSKMLIFSSAMAGLTVFLVFSYSASKSKVSVFRFGKPLTFVACFVSSVLSGVIGGFVIKSCLLSVPSLFR